jgi:hypothetical protein
VLFWADLLRREEELFNQRDAVLSFGELKAIELPFGIVDPLWLKSDPEMQEAEQSAEDAELQLSYAQ